MTLGKVKWFDRKKGFGFINLNDSDEDIFVHYSAIGGDGFKSLMEGDQVQFELSDGPKGKQAVNVERVGPAAESE